MESWGTEVNKGFSLRQSCREGIRVGEALTKSIKSSAGLSDALLAMVAMFLLGYRGAPKAVGYLVFGCVTIAKSRRLAKDIDRAFQV